MESEKLQSACLLTLTGIAVAVALYFVQPVAIPFVLALFIALGLTTILDTLMGRFGWSRSVALSVTSLVGLLLLFGMGLLIAASVAELSANLGLYEERLAELTESVVAQLPEDLRAQVEGEEDLLSRIPGDAAGNMLLGTTNAIAGILSQGVVVLIFVAFLVLGGSGRPSRGIGAWGEIERRVKKYIVAKTGISALTGLLVGVTYALTGVQLALVFGLLAFLLNFIPNVGSFIAMALPIPLIVMSPDMSTAAMVIAIGLPLIINVTIGNVLEPKMLGDTLELHPVTILLSLIFWGMLWGVAGMFLAVPLTSAVSILMSRLEPTEGIARIMAGDTTAFIAEDGAPETVEA